MFASSRAERVWRPCGAGPIVATGRLRFGLDKIEVVEDPAHAKPADVVLLAVKLYDVEASAKVALAALKPNGALVAIQNGINVYRTLKPLLPARRVAIGSVYSVTKLLSATEVTYGGAERAILGNPECALPPVVEEMVEHWKAVGVEARIAADINEVLWTKFVGLATGAAMNCLSRLPAGVIYHDPDLVEIVQQSIAEVIDVGSAVGIKLPAGTAENTLAFLKSFPPDAVASMRIDLDAGKRLELDGISGELVRLGKEHGVPTPIHKLAYAVLKHFGMEGPH